MYFYQIISGGLWVHLIKAEESFGLHFLAGSWYSCFSPAFPSVSSPCETPPKVQHLCPGAPLVWQSRQRALAKPQPGGTWWVPASTAELSARSPIRGSVCRDVGLCVSSPARAGHGALQRTFVSPFCAAVFFFFSDVRLFCKESIRASWFNRNVPCVSLSPASAAHFPPKPSGAGRADRLSFCFAGSRSC